MFRHDAIVQVFVIWIRLECVLVYTVEKIAELDSLCDWCESRPVKKSLKTLQRMYAVHVPVLGEDFFVVYASHGEPRSVLAVSRIEI